MKMYLFIKGIITHIKHIVSCSVNHVNLLITNYITTWIIENVTRCKPIFHKPHDVLKYDKQFVFLLYIGKTLTEWHDFNLLMNYINFTRYGDCTFNLYHCDKKILSKCFWKYFVEIKILSGKHWIAFWGSF